MAKYSTLIGQRIDVTYRAGGVVLPATGTLAADSGKSIFLEEHYLQQGTPKSFRWEIPYPCILQLNESPEIPNPSASLNVPRETPDEPEFDRSSLRWKNRLA